MPTHYYHIVGDSDADVFPLDTTLTDSADIAEEAAQDLFDKHDGWECAWPQDFVILTAHRRELGRHRVDRQDEPTFHARAIPKET